MRALSAVGLRFIKDHERLRLKSYQDSGGVWTIGYGHTGQGVVRGLVITETQADQDLDNDVEIAKGRLYGRVKPEILDRELTQGQYDALISFVLNLGADPGWTIWKKLNAREFDAVPSQIIRFVHDQDPVSGKTRKVQGLVNRRADELKLWSSFEPGSVPEEPSSSSTRQLVTPPTQVEKPAAKQANIWMVITTPILAAIAAFKDWIMGVFGLVTPENVHQITGAISPFSDKSPLVAGAISGLAVVGATVAAILVLRKHQEGR